MSDIKWTKKAADKCKHEFVTVQGKGRIELHLDSKGDIIGADAFEHDPEWMTSVVFENIGECNDCEAEVKLSSNTNHMLGE